MIDSFADTRGGPPPSHRPIRGSDAVTKPVLNRPGWQAAILAKCVHPSGEPVPWTEEDTERSIVDRFEQIVRRFPDRCAVASATHKLTYRELNQTANRIARAVLAANTDASLPVALLLEQGSATFAPMLGVLKAGRFFTPLEPDHPPDRLGHIIEDSKANLILTNGQSYLRAARLQTDGRHAINVDEIELGTSGEGSIADASPECPRLLPQRVPCLSRGPVRPPDCDDGQQHGGHL